MAAFLLWIVLWAAGGLFGPAQYHPPQPGPGHTPDPAQVEHESIGR